MDVVDLGVDIMDIMDTCPSMSITSKLSIQVHDIPNPSHFFPLHPSAMVSDTTAQTALVHDTRPLGCQTPKSTGVRHRHFGVRHHGQYLSAPCSGTTLVGVESCKSC
jgi:hypothetical protein